MDDETSKGSQCTCVSMIIKLDPNLLQRRESLFASSEAQSIIEQMTGVSSNGKVILQKPTKSEDHEPAENAQTDKPQSPVESEEESKQVTQAKKAKPSKATPKTSIGDVAAKLMSTNKLYTNDRTVRAVNKWRAFREKEDARFAAEAGKEPKADQDEMDEKEEEDKTSDSPSSSLPTSTPEAPIDTNKVDANIEGDKETDKDSDGDKETKSTIKARAASPTPPISPVLRRPARARFGRRYSMPLNALPSSTGAPQPSLVGSPEHGTPKSSRDPSPQAAPRPYLTAAITHLQNNREKLSTLFDKRSAVISTLDKGNEVTGPGGGEKKVTRLCRRRASDSTATLSEFLQQQQINLNRTGTGRLLQRRGSVCATGLRNRQTPATELSHSPRAAPISNDCRRPELKSRSCEDVTSQNQRGQPHPPWAYTGGRRGSICVGQVARARDETPTAAQSPRKPEASLGLICSVKKPFVDKDSDETSGGNNDSVNSKPPDQGPSHQYMGQRRGSVSTAQIARAREMMQERQAQVNSNSKRNELSNSAPLTLANIETHNSLLSPFSLQLYNERISSAGLAKTGDSPKSAEISDKSSAADGGDQAPKNGEPQESKREEAVGAKEAGSSPRRASTPAVQVPDFLNRSHPQQRRYSLFLRTESEIKEDVEQEIQERVARRRRELLAVRCVSAKGAQRLEARAMAQSAAGRLKRNLHEVTKQRKTKELMQIEEERNRLYKQMLLLS